MIKLKSPDELKHMKLGELSDYLDVLDDYIADLHMYRLGISTHNLPKCQDAIDDIRRIDLWKKTNDIIFKHERN